MTSAYSSLLDPAALGIVAAGTALGTMARCGVTEFSAALRAAGGLVRRGFAREANRKALALAVTAIRKDGHLRANPALPPDRALAAMVETYLRHGRIDALGTIRRSERAQEEARRVGAAQVFGCAGELAPVFGLIGTLYGLAGLAPGQDAAAVATIMGAVSTAVLTSLYGALIAHLVCFPLASAIERRSCADERHREMLADWFAAQIGLVDTDTRSRYAHLRGVA
jgi:chemotaxis protein MotA